MVLIIDHRTSLPKCISRVSIYALDNPNEIASDTVASIANQIGVQP